MLVDGKPQKGRELRVPVEYRDVLNRQINLVIAPKGCDKGRKIIQAHTQSCRDPAAGIRGLENRLGEIEWIDGLILLILVERMIWSLFTYGPWVVEEHIKKGLGLCSIAYADCFNIVPETAQDIHWQLQPRLYLFHLRNALDGIRGNFTRSERMEYPIEISKRPAELCGKANEAIQPVKSCQVKIADGI